MHNDSVEPKVIFPQSLLLCIRCLSYDGGINSCSSVNLYVGFLKHLKCQVAETAKSGISCVEKIAVLYSVISERCVT